MKEEGRRKKEEGRRKKEEGRTGRTGRRKKEVYIYGIGTPTQNEAPAEGRGIKKKQRG
jgi:hypothetical protein